MALTQEQPAAGGEQGGDDTGPPADVRQPAERPDPGEDQVERPVLEHVGGAVEVRLHVVDLGAGVAGQGSRLCEGGRGEVQPGHPGAEPVQGQRVRADVALQVDAAHPGDVAEPRHVESHHMREEGRVGAESLDGVPGRCGMRRGTLVPVLLIQFGPIGPVGHVDTLASRRPAGALMRHAAVAIGVLPAAGTGDRADAAGPHAYRRVRRTRGRVLVHRIAVGRASVARRGGQLRGLCGCGAAGRGSTLRSGRARVVPAADRDRAELLRPVPVGGARRAPRARLRLRLPRLAAVPLPAPSARAPGTPQREYMLGYGFRLGAAAAIAAALGFGFGFDPAGWACGAVLLVMRPSVRVDLARGLDRTVTVVVGALCAVGLIRADLPDVVLGAATDRDGRPHRVAGRFPIKGSGVTGPGRFLRSRGVPGRSRGRRRSASRRSSRR